MESLKEAHPQKYYFKFFCRIIYYMGMGDVWYENKNISVYGKMWAFVSYIYLFLVVVDQFFSHARNDLSEKEKNDLFLFNFGHTSILAKIVTVYFYKDRITVFSERLLEGTRASFNALEIEKKSVKLFMIYCIALASCCYVTMVAATTESITSFVKEGIPIRTEVVYYPSPSHSGILANICRFFVVFHWYWSVTMMVSIDCLTLCSLVVVGHKFKVIQKYFEVLRTTMIEKDGLMLRKDLEKAFKKDFIVGITMHDDALCCARNLQRSLGPIYSIQLFESVFLLVVCLIKFVVGDRTLIYLLANFLYVFSIIIVTGSYMMAAGDITYEAELVSTSIFHCGWELYGSTREFRVLAVVALQRSQVPVVMYAFGVFALSYSNFISVLRSSYSIFAVFY